MSGVPTGAQYGGMFVNVGIEQLRKALAIFAAERSWADQHTPRNLLISLFKEVGELSGLFQWRGEVSPQLPGFSPADKHRLAQELAEVLLYLIRLADVCEVDLGRAVLEKLSHNAAKYPKPEQQQSKVPSNRCITTGLLAQPPRQQSKDAALTTQGQLQQQQQQPQAPGGMYGSRLGSSNNGSNTPSSAANGSTAGFICNLPSASRQQQQQQHSSSVSPGLNLGEGIIIPSAPVSDELPAITPSSIALASTSALKGAAGGASQQLPQQQPTQHQTSTAAAGAIVTPDSTAATSGVGAQIPAVTVPLSAVRSPLVSPAAVAALIQQQEQGLLSTPASAGDAITNDLQSTTSFNTEAAGLLPQGLLDEIGHRRGHVGSATGGHVGSATGGLVGSATGGHVGSAIIAATSDGAGVSSSSAGGPASEHAKEVSEDCGTAPASINASSPADAGNAAAAPVVIGQPCNDSSSQGSRGNSGSGSDKAAAAEAASAAACSSAAPSLWLTAAMARREASTSSTCTSALVGSLTGGQSMSSLSSTMTSYHDSSIASCSTGHHSWQFSASLLEPSSSQLTSIVGEHPLFQEERGTDSEAGRLPSSTTAVAVASGNSTSATAGGRGASCQQYTPPGVSMVSPSSPTPARHAGFGVPSPQQQQQPNNNNSSVSRAAPVPVVSLAAAVAAAAAAAAAATSSAAALEPAQHLTVSLPTSGGMTGLPCQQQLSPARLMPPPFFGAYDLCSRCGGLHAGKCPTKARCMRCFRKAHLGDCWTRCVSCNLVHAPGKCRAAPPAGRDSSSSRDQQQQQQQQQGLPSPGSAGGGVAAG